MTPLNQAIKPLQTFSSFLGAAQFDSKGSLAETSLPISDERSKEIGQIMLQMANTHRIQERSSNKLVTQLGDFTCIFTYCSEGSLLVMVSNNSEVDAILEKIEELDLHVDTNSFTESFPIRKAFDDEGALSETIEKPVATPKREQPALNVDVIAKPALAELSSAPTQKNAAKWWILSGAAAASISLVAFVSLTPSQALADSDLNSSKATSDSSQSEFYISQADKDEQARIAQEQAEMARLKAELAAAEEARIAAEAKAEQEAQIAAELKAAEEARIAAEAAEQARLAEEAAAAEKARLAEEEALRLQQEEAKRQAQLAAAAAEKKRKAQAAKRAKAAAKKIATRKKSKKSTYKCNNG